MKVRLQVIVDLEDGGPAAVHEVAQLDREGLQLDTLGLQLTEAKHLLQQVQKVMIDAMRRAGCAVHSGGAPAGCGGHLFRPRCEWTKPERLCRCF